MQFDAQQVLALAPDSGTAANGRKLAQPGQWPTLGRSTRAIWGECQGSGAKPYQVRVDLADFASKCSCPSFKFPCKHAVGLLLLAADHPARLAETAEPEWVADWLGKRAETAARKETRAQAKSEAPPDEAAQRKRADRRETRVRDGLTALATWLEDLVRNGLARLPAEGPAPWNQQAARLVDAQASAVAARVRELADLPGSGEDWPERLLDKLGLLALLVQGYDRIEALPPGLAESLRQLIGFSVREEDVLASGETVSDRWQVVGRAVEEGDRVRALRTWIQGEASGRFALLLQFAVGNAAFATTWPTGSAFEAEIAFYPGTGALRAVPKGQFLYQPLPSAFSRTRSIAELLSGHAAALAANPWIDRTPVVLARVVPARAHGRWLAVGMDGEALPLSGRSHWLWLALSGGKALDLAAEWDGASLVPLGVFAEGRYHALTEEP